MTTKEDSWMLTASGKQFHPFKPTIESINIEDIAHALSNICRFGGHTREFYSVAQHSMLVSDNVPPEHRLQALLHDAAEAYAGDVIQPIKLYVRGFSELEGSIWPLIAKKFNVPVALSSEVKKADFQALLTERRDLMKNEWEWDVDKVGLKPFKRKIRPDSPKLAKSWFNTYFKALTK